MSTVGTNATRLRAVIERILATAFAASLVACGANVTEAASGDAGDTRHCQPSSPVDAGAACTSWVVELTGDLSTCGLGDAYADPVDCAALCGRKPMSGCELSGSRLTCNDFCPVDGRRPPVALAPPSDDATLGTRFARMAYFEAASVIAFETLHRELSAHGAPASLLRSIQRARRDEIRHAAMAATLARRFGASVSGHTFESAREIRSLEAIALENAVEGCGRETLGAAFGLHLARTESSPRVRRFYAAVARDELRHASLAWRLQAWLLPRLDAEARERVRRAWEDALRPEQVGPMGGALREALAA